MKVALSERGKSVIFDNILESFRYAYVALIKDELAGQYEGNFDRKLGTSEAFIHTVRVSFHTNVSDPILP